MLDSRSRTTTRDVGTSPMHLVTCTVVTAVENHCVVGQTTNIDVAALDATMPHGTVIIDRTPTPFVYGVHCIT